MSSKPDLDKTIDKDELRNYQEKFTKYKITLIENATTLETQLEGIISSYFSKSFDDYTLMNNLIFSDTHLGFSDKITMFAKLGPFLPEFKEGLSDVVSQLNQIKRLRNDFVHASIGIYTKDISSIDKEILFLLLEKGTHKQKSYTFDHVDTVLTNYKKLHSCLSEVIFNLKRKNNINQNWAGFIVTPNEEII